MNKNDYESILKYLQIHIYIDGELMDSTIMESFLQNGDFESWLPSLCETRLEGNTQTTAPFYIFQKGKRLTNNGLDYVIQDVIVEFYSDYPNPGGYPVMIVKLYLGKIE